jgi:ectoine hydroxylase-related dioxygenase (phytanoyl-CoA dioxygenase family)
MDWRTAIEKTGLAIVPGVLGHEYLDRLLEEINALAPRRSRAGVRHALGLAPVAALAQRTELIEMAQKVLGPNAFPFRATFFDKSPQSNWLVVWHQDTALPLKTRLELPGWGPWSMKDGIHYAHAPSSTLAQVLALRIHFDDSTASNGPLRVLPGTHTLGVLSDDTVHEIAHRTTPFDCVVPKGGIVAMRPLLIHASSKSQTEIPRRVLHIEYAASVAIAEPLQLAVT